MNPLKLSLVIFLFYSQVALAQSKNSAMQTAAISLEATARQFEANLKKSLSLGRTNVELGFWPKPYTQGRALLVNFPDDFIIDIEGTKVRAKYFSCWGGCRQEAPETQIYAAYELKDYFDSLGNRAGCNVVFYLNEWLTHNRIGFSNYNTGRDLGGFNIADKIGPLPPSFKVEGCN